MNRERQRPRSAWNRESPWNDQQSLTPDYRWFIIAVALLASTLGMIPTAKADSYPVVKQWYYFDGTYHYGYASSDEAAQAAYAGWHTILNWKNPVNVDWFLNNNNCSSKTFVDSGAGQYNYIHVLISTPSGNGGFICENTLMQLRYGYYCPYGGTFSIQYGQDISEGICIDAPPCPAPQVRDATTGECKCQPPNAINPANGQCEPTCKSPDVTDPATGQCVHCTVNSLPQPPFKGDTNPACTASLEKGKGKDVDHKCPSLNPKMTEPNGGQIQCLADKINKLALTPAYTGPSATIRTEAYQQHLVDIWKKWSEEIVKLNGAEKQACAAVIADVTREKKEHGIDFSPSKKKNDAPHVKGNALDIPRDVAKALMAKLTDTTVIAPVNCFLSICMSIPVHIGDVQDYVNSETLNPPACDLLWGGRFGDKVHFQLQHP